MLRSLLCREGRVVDRRHVDEANADRGDLPPSQYLEPKPGHMIHPYLPRTIKVERPNHVWAMDITHIPMAKGFVYRAAVVDWFTRRVLTW